MRKPDANYLNDIVILVATPDVVLPDRDNLVIGKFFRVWNSQQKRPD
jgi:hypothetical protein